MLSIVIVCLALIASGSCLKIGITGGTATDIGQHPYQVSIHYKNKSIFILCGGSIISEDWILTAAHCVEDNNLMLYEVRVGSTFHDKGGILISYKNQIKIAKIVVHNKYRKYTYEYDAALIKLTSPLTITGPNIKKVLLAYISPRAGTQAVVTGWGDTSGKGEISKILQKLTVPVIDQQKCQTIYALYRPVTSTMLCAGRVKKDTCKGDSGGALVYKDVQIGIVSWGPKCGSVEWEFGLPGVYTRISVIRQWIKNQANV